MATEHLLPQRGAPAEPAAPIAAAERFRRLSAAEEARTLVDASARGALATLAAEPPGYPFGSVAPYGLLADGSPVLFVSALAEHTRNLDLDPRASLLITEPDPVGDPMDNGRLTLIGTAARVTSPGDALIARHAFLERNPEAASYIGFGDFAFWLLRVEAVRWVGGFGRMAWCESDDYRIAEPDPTRPAWREAVAHLNADHADVLLAAARAFGGCPDSTNAAAVRIDRYGIDLVVETPRGPTSTRVGFAHAVAGDGLRAACVDLAGRARAALAGVGSGG